MKKIILFMILFVFCFNIYGQKKNYLSTEFDANYYYCFIGENTFNNFSYGFSLLISEYIGKIRISTGVNYSSLSFDSQGDQFFSVQKHEYKLGYLKFPITSNFKIFSHNKIALSFLTGFVFSHLIDYSIKSYYLNGDNVIEDDLLGDRQLGVSWRFGMTLSKTFGNKFLLNMSPFFNYQLIPDSRDQRPDYNNIPDYISVGLKIGIEYMFKASDN